MRTDAIKLDDQITINADGNLTVFGAHAHRLYFAHGCSVPAALCEPTNPNSFFVLEVDGTVRAAQTTLEGALTYMDHDRVLVVREPAINEIIIDTDGQTAVIGEQARALSLNPKLVIPAHPGFNVYASNGTLICYTGSDRAEAERLAREFRYVIVYLGLDPQAIIESVLGKLDGRGDNVYLGVQQRRGGTSQCFNDPLTGSTLMMKTEEVSDPEAVRQYVERSRSTLIQRRGVA